MKNQRDKCLKLKMPKMAKVENEDKVRFWISKQVILNGSVPKL
jgi:hypothetical protein